MPRLLLPKWLWLWFPPLLVIIVFAVKVTSPTFYDRYIEGERGLVELASPIIAFWAFAVGLSILRNRQKLPSTLLRGWLLAVTLACFYLGGEELSWGQQLFQWETPAEIATLNDQQETNLHNMSSWFDQKPRLLLELWVLIGGIIVPLWWRFSSAPRVTGDLWAWFWPAYECLPTAVLAIAIRLPQRYKSIAGLDVLPFEIRWSEPQEYYFALFLLIYLSAIRARMFERIA
ncbi:MAG: hypothetical protein EXR86_16790 [Gammaproteobacteria bacterium]|nr:hypothetical protein [Gammaproteobacteria bacterium]